MSDPDTSTARTGTQSLERAVLLLREVATRGATGWRPQDLAEHCGLDRGTVHRLLKCLVEERLVRQRSADKRYLIGPLAYELGLSVPGSMELGEAIRSTVRRLVRELPKMIAVTSFLRSGDDYVCVARGGAASHFTDAARTRPGKRVPLLSGAGGIAILADLPVAAAASIRKRNLARLTHLGTTYLQAAEALLESSRGKGHAFSEGVMWQGVNSLGVPFGPPGAPVGCIVVSAWIDDYSAADFRRMLAKMRPVLDLLSAEAAQVES